MDELRDQPTRRRILDEVAARPGSSGRDIQRRLALGWGETVYHLDRLARAGAVHRERGGRRDFYFAEGVAWEDRKLLRALQGPSERAILLFLSKTSSATFAQVQTRTGIGKSTVSYHLSHLLARGTVERVYSQGDHLYRLTSPRRLGELLSAYEGTFGDRLVDGLVASFSGLMRPGRDPPR